MNKGSVRRGKGSQDGGSKWDGNNELNRKEERLGLGERVEKVVTQSRIIPPKLER